MKKITLLLLSFLIIGAGSLTAQSTPLYLYGKKYFDVFEHPGLGDTVGISDVWGWESPEGVEYAIIGVLDGVSFVRISDMEEVAHVPGPVGGGDPYYHRDIKTYGNYCYVVSEMTGTNEGIQVIDMSYLPDSASLINTHVVGFKRTSHNLSIDVATGFAYVEDAFDAGVRFIDLSDPENLVETFDLNVPGVHDIYARNDTLWVAEGSSKAFSVYDVSDKTSPVMITRIFDPTFGYCHNIWPTDDGKYFITTEETDNRTIKIWNMTDPVNVTLESEFLAPCSLAHNVHVMGDSVYTSHYESGVTVVDISDKTNPIEVRHFDTYPLGESSNFRGCWGAYPFTPSGLIYTSSFEGWLHVLSFDSISVGMESPLVERGGLHQNTPNPFAGETTIPFEVKQAGKVRIEVLNLLGEQVERLIDETKAPGNYSVELSSGRLSPGMYIVRMEQGGFSNSIKIFLTE